MTKAEMEEAVMEARHVIDLIERGTLQQTCPGELEAMREILRDREAWLRGEVILTAKIANESSAEALNRIRQKLMRVTEGAKMYTQPQALKLLRSLKLMNHSPLRQKEKEWLDSIFLWDRISRELIEIAIFDASAEEAGGHTDHAGNYFRCRNCPDSLNRKR